MRRFAVSAAKGTSPKSKKKSHSSASGHGRKDAAVQLGSHPSLDYKPVIDYFTSRGDYEERAFDRFFNAVEPSDELMDDEDGSYDFFRAFGEWFVFDCMLDNGRTPLEHYVLCAPMKADPAFIEMLRQSAKTRFFSVFWIRGVDEAAKVVTLEDAADGKTYPVHEEGLANLLSAKPAGVIGAHLVCVADEWRCPFGPIVYQQLTTDAEAQALLEAMGPAHGNTRGVSFRGAARLEYGPGGAADREFGVVRDPVDPSAAPWATKVLGASDSEVSPGLDVPPQERLRYLSNLERTYSELAEEYDLSPTWPDIVDVITRDGGATTAHGAIEELFGPGAIELEHLSDYSFNDLLTVFLGAWNLLPHASLGGHSISEAAWGK